MLNEKQIKAVERQLTGCADMVAYSQNAEVKERNRGYCQGIAFVLDKIGYAVEWDDEIAHVVETK